jgi:hypothetical protein
MPRTKAVSNELKKMLSRREAKEFLQISLCSLDRLLKDINPKTGKPLLPSIHAGNRVYIPRIALEKLISGGNVEE